MDRREFLRTGTVALGASLPSCSAPLQAPSATRTSRFGRLAGLADGLEAPGPSDFAERRERARRAMRETGLAALAIEPGPTMKYFSGVEWGRSERSFLLLLFETGDPVWVCPAFEERTARERIPANQDLRIWQEDESPFGIAADAARARGPVGIEPTVRTFVAAGLRESLSPTQVSLGAEAVRRCRMVKSEKELALLRRASEITKRCIAAVAPLATEGATEAEISTAMGEAHRAAGMTSPWALVLFGPNASFPHGTSQARRLQQGDVVLIDTGGSLQGYQSDVSRTWALGRPSDRVLRAYDAVFRAQAAARAGVRPGRPCGDIDAMARAVIDASGFGTGYAAFTHRLGHGIGMEGHEEPYLVRGNATPIAAGMAFSDEPGIYVPGEFGIRIEDILAATGEGSELLGPDPPPEPRFPA
ncbi:MAG TPA: Xaa-Pro peptidase family protein [Planctomycetota bacterium]|jgi:Xaa-Pro dipeptidase|nr:Xaa-Pro peptidase family protein [Planctomycetota bacterium]